jgi:hypothetical protein
MRRSPSATTVVAVLAGIVLLRLLVGGAQSAHAETAKAEVRAALDEYVKAFSAERPDVIADRVYLAPSFNLAPNGDSIVSNTTGDVRRRFEAILTQLARRCVR